jgi:carbon storage regulator
MLVLSRKLGERIVIGNDISLTIIRASRSRVTVGVEAPRNLTIVRKEPKRLDRRSK